MLSDLFQILLLVRSGILLTFAGLYSFLHKALERDELLTFNHLTLSSIWSIPVPSLEVLGEVDAGSG